MNAQRLAEHFSPCVLCTGTEFRFLVTGYDRMQARDENYDYLRCMRCGLVARRVLPTPEEIHPKPHKAYRDLMSPVTYAFSLFGRGDLLEADLRAF